MNTEFSYQFERIDNSFIISAKDRLTTRALLNIKENGWRIESFDDQNNHHWNGSAKVLDQPRLTMLMASSLMSYWQPKKEFKNVRNWAEKQTVLAISKRVKMYWKEIIEQSIPDHKLSLIRKVYGTTLDTPDILWNDNLYLCTDFVKDLHKYRAARIALLDRCYRKAEDFVSRNDGWRVFNEVRDLRVDEIDTDWRKIYAHNQKSYHPLNKTLDNLPGGLPAWKYLLLGYIKLHRPITDRLELTIAICFADRLPNTNHPHQNANVFLNAKNKDIKRAIQIVNRYRHTNYSHRKFSDMASFVSYLYDFPDHHTGNIYGLAEKSNDWHQQLMNQNIEKQLASFNDDTPVVVPPIPLPTNKDIRFLDTVGKIKREGAEMGHCIGSYAGSAQKGYCYLFSVEHDGERASVEVSPDGRIQQSYGEHNSSNKASQWAHKTLEKWAKPMKQNRYIEDSQEDYNQPVPIIAHQHQIADNQGVNDRILFNYEI